MNMEAITEKEYRQLKQEVEDAKAASQRARGQMDQLLARLKEEHGCASVDAARTLLEKKKKELERLNKTFREEMVEYERKWKRD